MSVVIRLEAIWMKVIKVKDIFPAFDFLSSRENGLLLRNLALLEIRSMNKVVIDFSGFDAITQSFTDELIGVIVRESGIDFVKNHIEISNAGRDIRAMLNLVVSYSSNKFPSHTESMHA